MNDIHISHANLKVIDQKIQDMTVYCTVGLTNLPGAHDCHHHGQSSSALCTGTVLAACPAPLSSLIIFSVVGQIIGSAPHVWPCDMVNEGYCIMEVCNSVIYEFNSPYWSEGGAPTPAMLLLVNFD